MAGPDETIALGPCEVRVLGTVAGFVPDGDRVRQVSREWEPEAIVVGIPPEDLLPLGTLMETPPPDDMLELDGNDERFLELLARFGPVQPAPSPDLAAAFATGLALHAADLDDHAHTEAFTRRVKVRHLVQRSKARNRQWSAPFSSVADPYQLAIEWDGMLGKVKPLAALEKDREAHMVGRILDVAHDHRRLLAVVPAPLFAGIVTRLRALA